MSGVVLNQPQPPHFRYFEVQIGRSGGQMPAVSLEDARRLVERYVEHYNNVRLNSAIGYITPRDVLAGRQQEIHTKRDRKLEAARQQRQSHRQQAA
jgi:Integrase core domain